METVFQLALRIPISTEVPVYSARWDRSGMESNAPVAAIVEEFGIRAVEIAYVPVD